MTEPEDLEDDLFADLYVSIGDLHRFPTVPFRQDYLHEATATKQTNLRQNHRSLQMLPPNSRHHLKTMSIKPK